jgi:hypothetical protein
MRKAKSFTGRDPNSEEWSMVGEVKAHGHTWRVWMKAPNAGGWSMVKVAVLGEVKRKANFWTSWNGERFAASGDLQVMAAHRPDLYAGLLALPAFNQWA